MTPLIAHCIRAPNKRREDACGWQAGAGLGAEAQRTAQQTHRRLQACVLGRRLAALPVVPATGLLGRHLLLLHVVLLGHRRSRLRGHGGRLGIVHAWCCHRSVSLALAPGTAASVFVRGSDPPRSNEKETRRARRRESDGARAAVGPSNPPGAAEVRKRPSGAEPALASAVTR